MKSGITARISEISHAEALRYLGIRGAVPGDISGDLNRCEKILRQNIRPRITWKLLEISSDGSLAGTSFRPEGSSVMNLLKGCGQAVMMAATLGPEAELLLRRTQRQSIADAAMLDALANAAIENVCDNLCADLADALAPRILTPRFSPGYGDFPLSQQKDFFSVLNLGRTIGVTLTPGYLMVPQKTVTALMGLCDHPPVSPGGGCETCRLAERCLYRKDGISCGK